MLVFGEAGGPNLTDELCPSVNISERPGTNVSLDGTDNLIWEDAADEKRRPVAAAPHARPSLRQGARTSSRSHQVSDLAKVGAIVHRTARTPRPPADPLVPQSIDYHGDRLA